MGVMNNSFVVLEIKDPTLRELKILRLNDQALNVIYEAHDPKVFEPIKDLEFAHEVRIRL